MPGLQAVLDALRAHGFVPRRSGPEWRCRCPVHGAAGGDSSPSLSLTEASGTPLIICRAGCDTSRVLSALGLRWGDVLDESCRPGGTGLGQLAAPRCAPAQPADEWVAPVPPDAPPAPVDLLTRGGQLPSARHRYLDAEGRLLWGLLRWDGPAKTVRPLSLWRVHGALSWRLRAPPQPRPLYGLDRLRSQPELPVLLVEGEKAADAAAEMLPELAVLCWPGGTGAADRVDWAPLQGHQVTCWPDADRSGIEAMEAICEILGEGTRLVEVSPWLTDGWDLADPLPDGWTVDTVRGMIDWAWTPNAEYRRSELAAGHILREWDPAYQPPFRPLCGWSPRVEINSCRTQPDMVSP